MSSVENTACHIARSQLMVIVGISKLQTQSIWCLQSSRSLSRSQGRVTTGVPFSEGGQAGPAIQTSLSSPSARLFTCTEKVPTWDTTCGSDQTLHWTGDAMSGKVLTSSVLVARARAKCLMSKWTLIPLHSFTFHVRYENTNPSQNQTLNKHLSSNQENNELKTQSQHISAPCGPTVT